MIKLLLFCILCSSQPVTAEVAERNIQSLEDMFDAPCTEMGISKPLAMAIARVESGMKPWALNIEGKSFRFDSKGKALKKAKEAWEAGRSFDVGLMQVNSWWLARYDISLEAALDPVANIYFGVWILKQELIRHGNLKAAIGAYHLPTPTRANNYANKVMAALERGPKTVKSKHNSPKKKTDSTPIVILSRSTATVNGMKIADTATQNSMKIEKVKP